MQYGNFKIDVLKILDEYSARGTALSSAKTADLELRMGEAVNDILLDLAQGPAKIPAVFTIVQNPVENEIGYDTSEIQSFLPGGDDYTVELEAARSYYYEATGPSDVYVEEYDGAAWNTLSTATLSSTVTSFTEVKGLVSAASSTSNIRLRFTGDYPYSFRNYKLYPYLFASTASVVVQQHRPYFRYDLPSDYLVIDKVQYADQNSKLETYNNYYLFEADKQIGISRYDVGEFILNYYRLPTEISTAGSSTETVDCLTNALHAAKMGVAAKLEATENVQLSAYLMNMYEARKASIEVPQEVQPDEIENVTGW